MSQEELQEALAGVREVGEKLGVRTLRIMCFVATKAITANVLKKDYRAALEDTILLVETLKMLAGDHADNG